MIPTAASDLDLASRIPADLVRQLLACVRASGGLTETTRAPFTAEELLTYPISTEDDVEQAYQRARVAQRDWAARPPAERARIIARMHHAALRRQHELLDLLQLETGKSRYDAFQEFAAVPVYARYIGRTAPRVLAPQRRKGIIPLVTKAYELRHPKGVVGLVTAWNYPAVFAASDGLAALAGGNAVVHRPDVQSALSAIWVRQLAVEAGVPEEAWQIVLGPGRVIGRAVIERSDAVAFTGSTAAGRAVAAQTAPKLVYTSLELGGKNPFIVLPDAPIEAAVDAVVRACFVNAGQTCVGPERIIVASQIAAQFEDALVARVARIRVGASLSYEFETGSLIDAAQLESVSAQVEDAVAKGAKVLVGGTPRPDIGPYFYAPTVLTGVEPSMDLCRGETFGPVVALYTYDTIDQAVDLANDTEFGLHAVVWGADTAQAERVAARVRAGTVEVNDGIVATWGSADLVQGGVKSSGIGRRNGEAGILRFTDAQSIAVQRVHGLHPPGPMSQELFAVVMTHSLRALHMLPRR